MHILQGSQEMLRSGVDPMAAEETLRHIERQALTANPQIHALFLVYAQR
jgi:hypothetical protein